MNDNDWEDSAIKTVRELRDSGDLIASFVLCSAFVEHYCKTRLFVHLMDIRPMELIKVRDKTTKKIKEVFITTKMKKTIFDMSQGRVIEMGLLVRAWNHELYTQLKLFNRKRNHLVHKYETLLKILKEDEKEVRNVIELGLPLLHNIKLGYIQS
jgi:hypothetical protein